MPLILGACIGCPLAFAGRCAKGSGVGELDDGGLSGLRVIDIPAVAVERIGWQGAIVILILYGFE